MSKVNFVSGAADRSRRMRSKLSWVTFTAVLMAAAGGSLFLSKAQAAQQTGSSSPNNSVEGDWVRTDMNESGSFDGLNSKIAPPQLTPAGQALAAGRGGRGRGRGPAPGTTDGPHAAGQPYIVVAMPCGASGGNGAGSFGPDSGGFHIIVGKNQVVWSQERGGSRIIYMDGRPQPDISKETRPAYHSVGHFDNGVLVVDTVGLPAGGGVPGGGVRGANTHLTERFEVSPDGQHMQIVYTYTDPELYVSPFSYTYTFDRAPNPPTYAFEEWCDASDPIERQSIVPPAQN
jgi:hypothetical protein